MRYASAGRTRVDGVFVEFHAIHDPAEEELLELSRNSDEVSPWPCPPRPPKKKTRFLSMATAAPNARAWGALAKSDHEQHGDVCRAQASCDDGQAETISEGQSATDRPKGRGR